MKNPIIFCVPFLNMFAKDSDAEISGVVLFPALLRKITGMGSEEDYSQETIIACWEKSEERDDDLFPEDPDYRIQTLLKLIKGRPEAEFVIHIGPWDEVFHFFRRAKEMYGKNMSIHFVHPWLAETFSTGAEFYLFELDNGNYSIELIPRPSSIMPPICYM